MRFIWISLLLAMWVILFTVLIQNVIKQVQLQRINSRVIKYYQVKAELPKEAKIVSDSLSREISKDLKLRESYVIHNILLHKVLGILQLRYYLILISILTFGYFYYYRQSGRPKPGYS